MIIYSACPHTSINVTAKISNNHSSVIQPVKIRSHVANIPLHQKTIFIVAFMHSFAATNRTKPSEEMSLKKFNDVQLRLMWILLIF